MISNFLKVNIIIVLTVLSYYVALSYEYGFAKVFNYPSDMVSIDIKALFIAVLLTLFGIFVVFCMFYITRSILKEPSRIIALIVSVLFCCLFFYIKKHIPNVIYIVIVVILALCLLLFVAFLIYISLKENERQIEVSQLVKTPKNNLLKFAEAQSFTVVIIFLTVLFIALGVTGYATGKVVAEIRTDFYTFQSKGSTYAIIKKYDSNLITAKVTDNKLSSDITYFTTDSLNGLMLKYEEGIGRETVTSK